MGIQDKIENAKETSWITYYRPKEQIIYNFGLQGSATIVCHPRSKWLCIGGGEYYTVLQNKNVTISILTKDFESQWVEWKEDK